MKKIDINRPVQTRDGRKVTDLHRLSKPISEGETLIGVVEESDGDRNSYTWHEDGIYCRGAKSEADLVAVPEERVRWANAYPDWVDESDSSIDMVDTLADEGRIGLFKFTFTEGQDPKAEFVPLEEAE